MSDEDTAAEYLACLPDPDEWDEVYQLPKGEVVSTVHHLLDRGEVAVWAKAKSLETTADFVFVCESAEQVESAIGPIAAEVWRESHGYAVCATVAAGWRVMIQSIHRQQPVRAETLSARTERLLGRKRRMASPP